MRMKSSCHFWCLLNHSIPPGRATCHVSASSSESQEPLLSPNLSLVSAIRDPEQQHTQSGKHEVDLSGYLRITSSSDGASAAHRAAAKNRCVWDCLHTVAGTWSIVSDSLEDHSCVRTITVNPLLSNYTSIEQTHFLYFVVVVKKWS